MPLTSRREAAEALKKRSAPHNDPVTHHLSEFRLPDWKEPSLEDPGYEIDVWNEVTEIELNIKQKIGNELSLQEAVEILEKLSARLESRTIKISEMQEEKSRRDIAASQHVVNKESQNGNQVQQD